MRLSKDISVYNEATGFSLHSRSMGGLDREALSDNLLQSVKDGLVIPIELVQDDPLSVRVVIGDLTEAEEAEWVGRIVWKLRIPCGSLAVEGGLDPRCTDEDDFVQFIDIPAGDYRVEVLTYVHGVNGDYCISDFLKDEAMGTWFRRTRPDTPMPMWMKLGFSEEPELDPGHEEEWEKFGEYLDGLSMKKYDKLVDDIHLLDFIVRLTPLEDDTIELEIGEDGWFAIDTGARKPELCPLGINFESA
jgi:hypothetical protein